MDERPTYPTLFIALGATGRDVGLHVRKRLLTRRWNGDEVLERLADYPAARFLYFDLDPVPPAPEPDFRREEILGGPFDAQALLRTSSVHAWSPLAASDLATDDGQYPALRCVARLAFTAHTETIRTRLRETLQALQACASQQQDAAQRLGLKIDASRINVVIVASASDVSGSGSFIDMGCLVREALKELELQGATTLNLLLPGRADPQTQARAYATLMELERAQRGEAPDGQAIASTFFDILLIDNGNLAAVEQTPSEQIRMLGDMLFDDLGTTFLALRKQNFIAVHRQHQVRSHVEELPTDFEERLHLYFPKSYAAAGQAELQVLPGTHGAWVLESANPLDPRHGTLTLSETDEDPLFAALDALSPPALRETFSRWLGQAMPWVTLDFEGGRGVTLHGYICLLAVPQPQEFERRYGQFLEQCVPAAARLDCDRLHYIDASTPGRMTCFTRLTGFALNALSALPEYLASYRQHVPRQDLHLVRQHTREHPLFLGQAHYQALSQDLRLYLQAVALGILVRNDAQAYEFQSDGKTCSVGDEREISADGLCDDHRQQLNSQVQLCLADPSAVQAAALATLFRHYFQQVYRGPRIMTEKGNSEVFHSHPALLSQQLSQALSNQLHQQVPEKAQALLDWAERCLADFTHPVPGSMTEVYAWELHEQHSEKLQVRAGFFTEGWLDALFQPVDDAARLADLEARQAAEQLQLAKDNEPRYRLIVDGTEYGPYSLLQMQQYAGTGQVARQSLIWRPGMTQWQLAEALPELAALFERLTPPPLVVG